LEQRELYKERAAIKEFEGNKALYSLIPVSKRPVGISDPANIEA
jgi:hypothetical protein